MQAELSRAFCADMLRDKINVLHQPHRIPESISVDILHQTGFEAAVRKLEVHLIGLVDIAHLNRLKSQKCIPNLEQAAHFLQFFIKLHFFTSPAFHLRI